IQITIKDNKTFKRFTDIELAELFVGNIVYILIFLILVVWIFKKKNV
ncbi:ABC transporter permease, partial [Staphylococcus epidermidis]|nr:ABC transporter permease [Staphylococcus epidermidis]